MSGYKIPKKRKILRTITMTNGSKLTAEIRAKESNSDGSDDAYEHIYWFRDGKYITPTQMPKYKFYDNNPKKYRTLSQIVGRDYDNGNGEPVVKTPLHTPYWDKLDKEAADKGSKTPANLDIPLKGSKWITLRTKGKMNLADVPTNLLDSIAVNAGRSGTDFWTDAALIGKESTFGPYSHYQGRPYDPKGLNQSLSAYSLTNNHAFIHSAEDDYINAILRKYNTVKDSDLSKVEDNVKYAYEHGLIKDTTPHYSQYILADAFKRYDVAPTQYNPGQKNYVPMLNDIRQELLGEKQLQEYWNTRGKQEYARGQREGMSYGGKMHIDPSNKETFTAPASSLFAKGGLLEPKDAWDRLSIPEKADIIKVGVKHGIFDLQELRKKYNEFKEGGSNEEEEEVNTEESYNQNIEEAAPDISGNLVNIDLSKLNYNIYSPTEHSIVGPLIEAANYKYASRGNLYEGEIMPTQRIQIGKKTPSLLDFNTEELIANAERIEQQRKAMEEVVARRANDYLTISNDATSVANRRQQNQHLTERAIEGAKSHALWEKEHPNLTAWGNLLSAVPFAVAASPALETIASTAIGHGFTSGLNSLASATNAMPYASTILPWGEATLATASVAHGIEEAQKGTFTPTTALEVSPLVPPAIGIGSNLYLPHFREHLYASKAPIGYDGMWPAAKRIAEGVLSGRRADIENPFWFNNESAKTLAEYAFIPKNVSEAEKALYLKNFGQRALKARADIWRMYNRLPQKYNTFIESEKYSGAYTAPEDIKALKWVPFPDEKVDPGDFVNSVGGNVGLPEITKLGKGMPDMGYTGKEFGVTVLSDKWDLHPFSRPNDRLISRLQRGYNKLFNTDKAPEFKWLRPLDNILAKTEVGKLVHAKPILVKNEIPWTMNRKLITDANGNLNFKTSYTQGFNSDNILPQSVIDWKEGKPVLEDNILLSPESYNFLDVNLLTKSRKR